MFPWVSKKNFKWCCMMQGLHNQNTRVFYIIGIIAKYNLKHLKLL